MILKDRNLDKIVEPGSKKLLSGFAVTEDGEFIFCFATDKGIFSDEVN